MSQYVGDPFSFCLDDYVHPETGSTLALVCHKTQKFPVTTALAVSVAALCHC
jgi:hypothetical protein